MSRSTLKRLVSVLLVAALAIWVIAAKDIVLGLDLQGGVTMRYELLPPDTLEAGQDVGSMIQSTVDTLRTRIDAYGIKEHSMARQGEREIVIELPGSGAEEAETIKSVISRVGRLEWRIVAVDDLRAGLRVEEQGGKLAELLAANAGKLPEEIDVTALDLVFGDVRCRWFPYSDKVLAERRGVKRLDDLARPDPEGPPLAAAPLGVSDYELLRIESAGSRNFTGADIAVAFEGQDSRGYKAVGVRMNAARASEFADFTEENKGRHLCIVLDNRVAQPPAVINDRLDGEFVIQSGAPTGFSEAEIKDYLTVIRSGSLQMKPRLLYENSIGPSLGESAIKAGLGATLVGLVITIVFMLSYYRWHGLHASVTLIFNMLVLCALLIFLGATVTLPGLAGLVLTFGMSVDANILIYERMREEKQRSHSPSQVIKLGFDKALSAIIDSNVIAFISALILYKIGTGPVRGFAVVLMLGLVTAVFAALVVGRLIYDLLVETGRMKTIGSMARFLPPDTHIGFLRLGRTCLRISAVAVIGSLLAFFMTDRTKFGLDFLGGYKAQVRLAQAVPQGELKQRVDSVFPGAQVVSVADADSPDRSRARQFIIKVKDIGAAGASDAAAADVSEDAADLEGRFEAPLRQALSGLLLPDLVTDLKLEEDLEASTTAVSGTINFEGPADPAAVQRALTALSQAETTPAGPTSVGFRGTIAGVGHPPEVVAQRIKTVLERARGLPALSVPILESTTIGGRVGSELRDSAIRALLLSFAVIVIYIRLRFREYTYGVAAVIGLIHDMCITLGAIVLARYVGLIDIEIDLTMIAVFLTIIGYSLNDKIVLLDRVRENLPRLDRPLGEVMDVSMNEVLARTLLTASTVVLTLCVIFFMNLGQQNMLEGFAFAMIVGVIVGTYSSIFVASPVLLMLAARREGRTT